MKHSEKWYQRRLDKYFEDHYGEYEQIAEYYVNPAPNQWMFTIPNSGVKIKLICDDRGNVTEETYKLKGE